MHLRASVWPSSRQLLRHTTANLIVEGEAPLRRDAALRQLEHLHALAHKNHLRRCISARRTTSRTLRAARLAIEVVEEHDAIHVGQPVAQQELGHLQTGHQASRKHCSGESKPCLEIGEASHQSAGVNQCVVRRLRDNFRDLATTTRTRAYLCLRERLQQTLDRPVSAQWHGEHHRRIGQEMDHLAVRARLVVALAELQWQQLRGRAREAWRKDEAIARERLQLAQTKASRE